MRNLQTNSDWMWIKDWNAEDKDQVRVVYFRKEMDLPDLPSAYSIYISASSRYKLYVNGTFVQAGPEKGIKEYGYRDPAELSGFFRKGKNVIAVEVLRYPENSQRRNDSIVHTEYPGLFLLDQTEKKLLQVTDGWKCRKADHIRLEAEIFMPAPIHAAETSYPAEPFSGWKCTGYDDSEWDTPFVYSYRDSKKSFSPFLMKERDIPPMENEECRFRNVVCCRESDEPETVTKQWEELIQKGTPLIISPNTKQVVEISAGEMACGYPLWKVSGGKGTKIRVLYAEAYYQKDPDQKVSLPFPPKGDRRDFVHGYLHGNEETYFVTGTGTGCMAETYEPYWFKTFQFLRVSVETGEESLTIQDFTYRSTHYPLEVRTKVQASDPAFDSIWDICERTLKLCMHETYMDCPYYEQLQYVMDARTEILATYAISADDRLARTCMEAFRNSQQSSGLLKASAPTEWVNVIPGFSVYYIMMVHDHMMYFGDKELIKHHMNCIDSILSFFEKNLSGKGLVGKIGGVLYQEPYWSFIDWTKEWGKTTGVPTAGGRGDQSITMESLYYLYGLQLAADLAGFIGKKEMAQEYRDRSENMKKAILKWCTGKNGLIQDGPGLDEYSTHCQLFAVLTDTVSREKGRELLELAIGNDEIAQCSFSMCFYLFRALEKVEWYEKTDELWDMWRGMLKNHMTTCAESPVGARSDCHGWSALLLYEMPAVYLGVKPAEPGFAKILVKPVPGHLTSAAGDVVTPKGMVHVEWKKSGTEGGLDVTYSLPF